MAGYVRFLFAIMLCIANMIIYCLKVNLSTTIIGMVKKTDESGGKPSNECNLIIGDSSEMDISGDFEWTAAEQGLVVSMYFAGYLVGMFPSGYFADRFNTKIVLLICVFGNAIFTLLVPIAASRHKVLLTLRFLTGLVSSANLPVVNVLLGKWVVYEEKSLWVGIIYAGTSLGTVVSILSSGLIMKSVGWKAVFYIHGALPLIWCFVFSIFFADCPEEQKMISEAERQLLITSYGHRSPVSRKNKVPWNSIFTSVPFWALIFTHTLGNFAWYFLLTQMPLFMNKILRFPITSNVAITCAPYFVNAFTNPLIGLMLDFGRKRGIWSQTVGRKIAVGISIIPPCILLVIIIYVRCYQTLTAALLCASIILGGAIFVGHVCNHNDLAPNYAGILMGITNTPGTISAFILPALVGYFVGDQHSYDKWEKSFWIVIAAQILAFIIFLLFGSAKIQDWNNYPDGPPAEQVQLRTAANAESTRSD